MTELTRAQQQAVTEARESPARVTDDKGLTSVLLRGEDFDWVRGLLPDLADVPRALDPNSLHIYALVPAVVYERFKPLFEEDPLTPAERAAQLRDFGQRAGWDDPAMDVYIELDPRQQQ